MASLKGKVIAITGAASGMGAAIAQLVASRGAVVSIADMNEAGLQKTMASLSGERHIYTVVDVRDATSVGQWIERTVKELGGLDGAVNFAGVLAWDRMCKIQDETEDNWDFHMNVNAKGVFLCLQAQLRRINKGGSIVSATSVAGLIGWPTMTPYVASKHAVIGMTRTAAKENPHVRINCVAPGAVETAMMKVDEETREGESACQIQKRIADPMEVAQVVAFLLSDEASFVTAAVYNVDGGWVC